MLPSPRVTPRLPIWARALLAMDRAFERAHAAQGRLRDELFIALTSDEQREAVTVALYDRNPDYLRNGQDRQALFEWEAQLLHHPLVPKSGRVLVGAAGGGRETAALHRLGYAVDAFEPSPRLLAHARTVVPQARIVRGSYADLADATRGTGPLAKLVAGQRYDLVLLGWGSYSHIFSADERLSTLRAIRRLTDGPVIVSFETLRHAGRPRHPVARALREVVTPSLRRLRGERPSPHPMIFWARTGFLVGLDEASFTAEAAAAGYRVEVFAEGPYGHGLLMPAPRG